MICVFCALVKKSFLTSNLERMFLQVCQTLLTARDGGGGGGTHHVDDVSQKKTHHRNG